MTDKKSVATQAGQAAEREWSKLGRGNKRPITKYPEAQFEVTTDPTDFAAALDMHMQRHEDSCKHLARAIGKKGSRINAKTLWFWRQGRKEPNNTKSFEMLARIEERYRLDIGYFSAKLSTNKHSAHGLKLAGYAPATRRRIRWHLPDDFDRRSKTEQGEILQWVKSNILATTEYRRYHASTTKQRFGLSFETPRNSNEGSGEKRASLTAPEHLRREMEDLLSFKTSTLTALGFKRNGVWNSETANQKVEHFGLLFGALSAKPDSNVKGFGVPAEALTFAMLVFPGVWDWYLQWREQKRGFYTRWEVDMLSVIQGFTRPETGWMWQTPSLAEKLKPVSGLVTEADITEALTSWRGLCERMQAHAAHRQKEIERVTRVHRDPFEPILVILQAESPLNEYRKITEEILRRMPNPRRFPLAAAETLRSCLMLRFGLHSGLRQKNLRQLLFKRRDQTPSTERMLEDAKRGELRWNSRNSSWEIFIPANAFKNSESSYFSANPFRLDLPNVGDLYVMIEQYINVQRAKLLKGAACETFFVKTMTARSRSAEYCQTAFYDAWRYAIERYGIYNPYTCRGAIDGLLPHGPHNVRDVLATHVLKKTGSYEQASYAIQDTPEMVKSHYGRFLPQDKAALAAKVLNAAWNDAAAE